MGTRLAHDICADYADHGVDVTLFQRSSTCIMSAENGAPVLMKPHYWEGGPPIEEADLLANSIPILFSKLLAQRATALIKEKDKPMLDGLVQKGYKLNFGEDDSGLVFLALKRGGGYYIGKSNVSRVVYAVWLITLRSDVGACQMIIDGSIKLKSGTHIERFTEKGLKFEDGSELEADVVLFATGYTLLVSSPAILTETSSGSATHETPFATS